MKLSALKLVMAYNALFTVKKIPIHNYNRFRVLRKILKSLDDEYAIYQEKEQELVKRYAVLDKNGDPDISPSGRINFKSSISEHEYINSKVEMDSEIIEIEMTPITITEDEVKMIGLSYQSIEMLEGIVNIDWDEEKANGVVELEE